MTAALVPGDPALAILALLLLALLSVVRIRWRLRRRRRADRPMLVYPPGRRRV